MTKKPTTKQVIDKAKELGKPIYIPNVRHKMRVNLSAEHSTSAVAIPEEPYWHEVLVVSPSDQAIIGTDNELLCGPYNDGEGYVHFDDIDWENGGGVREGPWRCDPWTEPHMFTINPANGGGTIAEVQNCSEDEARLMAASWELRGRLSKLVYLIGEAWAEDGMLIAGKSLWDTNGNHVETLESFLTPYEELLDKVFPGGGPR